jgi:hypothetical protein
LTEIDRRTRRGCRIPRWSICLGMVY